LHVSPVIRQDASHKVTVGTKEMINNQVVDHLTASPSSSSTSSAPSESKTPPATPATPATVTTTPADYEYEGFAEEMPSKLRWLWVAIPVACVLTAIIVWYSVNKNRPEITRAESAVHPAPADVPATPEPQPVVDSAAQAAAADATPPGMLDYFIVIQTFKTGKAAEKKLKQRQGYGLKDLKMISNADSSYVRLGEPFRTPASDTTAMKDSIRKKYSEPVRLEIKQP